MIDYSIIATTYNDSSEVIAYLKSITEQSVPPKEIVIADGGSRDDTVKKIERFALYSKISIRVIKGKRLNISQGYNVAIKNTKNDWIGVTGIGNYYEAEYFEKLMKSLEKGGYDLTYSPIRGKDNNQFSIKYNNTILHGNKGLQLPIASNHGVLIKKNIFYEQNFFYERFIYAGEDTEFYTIVNQNGYKAKMVNDAVVLWFTPTTYKEYLKQVKNYSIAELQIHNNKVLFKNVAVIVLPIFIAAILLKKKILFCLYIISVLSVILILFMKFVKEGRSMFLWLCNKFLPALYYVRYCRFLQKKYRVKRKT